MIHSSTIPNWGYNSRSGVLSHCVSWNCGLLGHCMEFSASCGGVSGKKGGRRPVSVLWPTWQDDSPWGRGSLLITSSSMVLFHFLTAVFAILVQLVRRLIGPSCWQTEHQGLGQELTWALVSQIWNSTLSSYHNLQIFTIESSIASWLCVYKEGVLTAHKFVIESAA